MSLSTHPHSALTRRSYTGKGRRSMVFEGSPGAAEMGAVARLRKHSFGYFATFVLKAIPRPCPQPHHEPPTHLNLAHLTTQRGSHGPRNPIAVHDGHSPRTRHGICRNLQKTPQVCGSLSVFDGYSVLISSELGGTELDCGPLV